MVFSNWICTNSTKNMFVKIVHPGGHVELHDRAVLAAEIISRNPRFVVAHPHVFKQPWAIVAPETLLMPGQKFYVVPINTIRKLQKFANKYSPSPVRQLSPSPVRQLSPSPVGQTTPTSKSQSSEEQDRYHNSANSSTCWQFMNKNNGPKSPYCCMKDLDGEGYEKANRSSSDGSSSTCFLCMKTGSKSNDKANNNGNLDSGDEARSISYILSPDQTRKRIRVTAKGSPKRRPSFEYQWQPSLASINETEE